MSDSVLERSRLMRDGKRAPTPVTDIFVVKDTAFEYVPGTDRISKITQVIEMADGSIRTKVQEFTYNINDLVESIDQRFE